MNRSCNASWLGKLGALIGVMLGGLVILGTSDDVPITITRVQEEQFAMGEIELRYAVRAAPLDTIEVRVTEGVVLNWQNAPAVLPSNTQQSYIETRAIGLNCHQTCGYQNCDSYCDELLISVTREDATQVQGFRLTVDATASAQEINEIEIVRQ